MENKKTITLYDYAQINDGEINFDISDDIYDMGEYFGYHIDMAKGDYYDLVMTYLAKHLEIIKLQPNWYTIVAITKFVEEHKKEFLKLAKKVYTKEWYEEFTQAEYESEEYYDTFISLFIDIIRGNLSQNDYGYFNQLLVEPFESNERTFEVKYLPNLLARVYDLVCGLKDEDFIDAHTHKIIKEELMHIYKERRLNIIIKNSLDLSGKLDAVTNEEKRRELASLLRGIATII